MSGIVKGGKPNAKVEETTIQEFTADGQMIFNWPALENLSDGLPYIELDDPSAASFRFPHMNAIDIDKDDGQLLVSNRMLSEVTKIDRVTGEIIWRLGGAHNQFTFLDELHGDGHRLLGLRADIMLATDSIRFLTTAIITSRNSPAV